MNDQAQSSLMDDWTNGQEGTARVPEGEALPDEAMGDFDWDAQWAERIVSTAWIQTNRISHALMTLFFCVSHSIRNRPDIARK